LVTVAFDYFLCDELADAIAFLDSVVLVAHIRYYDFDFTSIVAVDHTGIDSNDV